MNHIDEIDACRDHRGRKTTTLPSFPAEIDHMEPKTQVSQVFYIAPLPLYQSEKPFFLNIPVHRIEGARQTNVMHTARDVTFTDIRGHEFLFGLDKTGFEICKMNTYLSYEDFSDPQVIVGRYFEEVAAKLKDVTGAKTVKPWDYQVRCLQSILKIQH